MEKRYLFKLFEAPESVDPGGMGQDDLEIFIDLFLTNKFSEDCPGRPQEYKELRKRDTAGVLKAMYPELSAFCYDFEAVSSLKKISPAEAKLRYRNLRLTWNEMEEGPYIDLFDETAMVCVPYSLEADMVKQTFLDVWGWLQIIRNETGYITYDPQLGRLVDFDNDFGDVAAAFAAYRDLVPEEDIFPA